MRKITFAGAACRLMMVVIGATLATSTIGLGRAAAKSYQVNGKWYSTHDSSGYDETGTASHYGPGFHGRRTANGETYDQWGMTAAHKSLPLGSHVYVTNKRNGKTVKVRINDRGPFVGGRIIDLSTHVAEVLGINGLGEVRVRTSGGGGGEDRAEKRRLASKAKQKDDDDEKPKHNAKVRVASAEADDKLKVRKVVTEKADKTEKAERTEARSKKQPPERFREYGGIAAAGPVVRGWNADGEQLVHKLETFAVAEVQAEWRKAIAGVRKS